MYFGFQNISVDYGKKKVLSGLTLDVPKGKVMTLIGQNGCGKSTLLKVIPRAVTPKTGVCVLDSKPMRGYRPNVIARRIAYLPQVHTSPPDIDVRTLVSYGRYPYMRPGRGLTKEDGDVVSEVIRMTGLEKLSSQRLSTLSGGERQRVSIARAVLRNPRILILDEATAAMDTETERQIQTALERLVKGRTTIMIAHRLSTLRDADKLIVIENGKMPEFGTHSELIAKKGIYFNLYKMQVEALKNIGIEE